jgi:small subunit ribosomal protein S26e
MVMPKKRKSRGRSKGSKGMSSRVQCDGCGAWVPRDKAIKITKPVSIVDPQLARDLVKQGAFIYKRIVMKYYCVSCAVYQHVVGPRQKSERKTATDLRY